MVGRNRAKCTAVSSRIQQPTAGGLSHEEQAVAVKLAEAVGFEPTIRSPIGQFSRLEPLGHASLPFRVLVLTIRLWPLVGLQTGSG